MFVNYEKLAKKIIEQGKEDKEFMKGLVANMGDLEQELKEAFIDDCLKELKRAHKLKLVEEFSRLNIGNVIQDKLREEIGMSINKNISKILED